MPKTSKNRFKQLATLKQKKIRDNEGLFIAEGEKIVLELLGSKIETISIIGTKEWMASNKKFLSSARELMEASEDELKRVSLMTTPNKVVAFAKIPETIFDINELNKKLTLVLDEIQDPGNLGTIIRIAEWFGIENVICSNNSVDLYNPKVIQATMGAFLRVKVIHLELNDFLRDIKKRFELPVYGAFLNGKNIYSANLAPYGLIVMGNESKGISKSIQQFIDEKITIPSFSLNSARIDSLNVSVATAIICSEFKSRKFKLKNKHQDTKPQ